MSENKHIQKIKNDQEGGARRGIIEELFNDVYYSRRRIYGVNFVRGLFFGFGSVLGGTLLVATTVWILSFFIDWFPFIEDVINAMSRSSS